MNTRPLNVLIVESRFYEDITELLVAGAAEALDEAGIAYDRLAVPGTFEIPATINMALDRYDAFVALGCVIRGETTHYDYVCSESARGLQELALHKHAAIGYGILTVENRDQAIARADPKQLNRGRAAAVACLRMIELKRHFTMI